MIINGNKTGWNKGDKGKNWNFYSKKMFCSKYSDRFLLSCNMLCTLNALWESTMCSFEVRFLQNIGAYLPNDTQLYITFQKTVIPLEHKSNNIMFTSYPHCVRGSGSLEVEMYTSETGNNTKMKFILKYITVLKLNISSCFNQK